MQDLDREKGKLKSCLTGFLNRLYQENLKRLTLRMWRVYFNKKKSTSSKVAYAINKLKRMHEFAALTDNFCKAIRGNENLKIQSIGDLKW